MPWKSFLRLANNDSKVLSKYNARKLLGLRRFDKTEESRVELRDKYFNMAKHCHPDSAEIGNKDAKKFALISEAYAVLVDGTNKIDLNPNGATNEDAINLAWAKMFFGSLAQEVTVSQDVIDGILDASLLSRGGLDKGGLWDFVDKFSAMHGNIITNGNDYGSSSSSTTSHDTSYGSSPIPFTRKRKS